MPKRALDLRVSLLERSLLPVFAALSRDIVAYTRSGVDKSRLGQAVVRRLVHWRTLLDREAAGLGEATLRGLIGELLVLRDRLLPVVKPLQAIFDGGEPSAHPRTSSCRMATGLR